ncbi:alginate export family protein [Gayadomonas joobiniege]|uniref:alginate export family protein n=1 Tax=Gayadomonas joobiniege TaxID=1234606 RepID=UPI00036A1659|nr:alginate export family protein [Gayadomonas joobiniege]
MKTTHQNKLTLLATLVAASVYTPNALAAETLAEAIKEGSTSVAVRTRYENVDQDGFGSSANALTVKTSLTYKTASLSGFSGLLQMDDVTAITDNYSVPTDAVKMQPVVADPEGTEVNQAFIQYTDADFTATYGRQIITHLNHRFLGHVGWRQNMQTYDGIRLQGKLGAISVDYSYLNNVNGILGTNLDLSAHNLLASMQLADGHTLSGFVYLYEPEAAADSTDTYGFDYSGSLASIKLHASYAVQSVGDFDASYLALDASYKVQGVTAQIGYELLGSDDGAYGFNTPLATKHAFNGWADLFLATGDNGLEDTYGKLAYQHGAYSFVAVYHSYSEDEGGADLGSEINLSAAYSFNKTYSLLLKFADFSSDSAKPDVTKTWIQLAAKF